MSLDDTHFDVVLVGTGLPESILAASLSRSSLSVLHIDERHYYGGRYASLSLSELKAWVDSLESDEASLSFPAAAAASSSEGGGLPPSLQKLDRHYSLSLAPALVPAVGRTIDVLIRSNVASYCTFRLLERTYVVSPAGGPNDAAAAAAPKLSKVPSSKEDIFKDKTLSLVEKRKLMKLLMDIRPTSAGGGEGQGQLGSEDASKPFLQFLTDKYELPSSLSESIAYGVALCSSAQEPTSQALERARRHLESIGRYGNSAYLVGQYGGAGELAQSYCRASAVYGGTYILGHAVQGLKREVGPVGSSASDKPREPSQDQGRDAAAVAKAPAKEDKERWAIRLKDVEEELTADWLVADEDFLVRRGLVESTEKGEEDGSRQISGILVLDRALRLEGGPQGAVAEGEEGAEQTQEPPETALIVFPPSSSAEEGHDMPVTALIMGEGTFSSPKGQYVVYLNTHVSSSSLTAQSTPEEILAPYRAAVLSLSDPTASPAKEMSVEGDAAREEGKPLVECYFSQRMRGSSVAAKGDATQAQGVGAKKLLSIPFPPPASSATREEGDNTASRGAAGGTFLPTLLDSSTALSEHLFWSIHGPSAHSLARQIAQRRKARRDPAEYVGRAGAEDAEVGRREREIKEKVEERGAVEFFKPKDAEQEDDGDGEE